MFGRTLGGTWLVKDSHLGLGQIAAAIIFDRRRYRTDIRDSGWVQNFIGYFRPATFDKIQRVKLNFTHGDDKLLKQNFSIRTSAIQFKSILRTGTDCGETETKNSICLLRFNCAQNQMRCRCDIVCVLVISSTTSILKFLKTDKV